MPSLLRDPERRIALSVGVAACAVGICLAALLAWTADDAFISYRYAHNLVRGLGLVFNPGERVEGYTNPLWTLWIALGIRLGLDAESFSIWCGILCYGALLGLLVFFHFDLRRRVELGRFALPSAAVVTALHAHMNQYATSGLETCAFTLAVFAAYIVLARGLGGSPARPVLAGLLCAIAALLRPDGVVFVPIGVVALLASGAGGVRAAGKLLLAFLLPFGAATLLRVGYYGDVFPNTYYAKSAYRTWHGQGLVYLGLYAKKYWPLLLGAAIAPVAWLELRKLPPAARSAVGAHLALASAFVVAYGYYVVRVGGDFMYARLLVPITPYLGVLLELALLAPSRSRPLLSMLGLLVVIAAARILETPVSRTTWISGVADERAVYDRERVDRDQQRAAVFERYFRDLDVRLAFLGGEARTIYLANVPVAIEADTGLTEPGLARRELSERGRVGHEKRASVEFLVAERRAHFIFSGRVLEDLPLHADVPAIRIKLDGVSGWVLRWDPPLMAELARRGARFPDFPRLLEDQAATAASLPADVVADDYKRLRLFYFSHVPDPEHERPFLERLRKH
jgi:hypothetical protein